ncbi:MAG: glycosyl transferase [Zetaproteobacteria bacterium]|nr:MAG: glycosyl transferase [Zetaproteobacteria bacterium]
MQNGMRILQVLAGAPHGGAETAFVDMCIAMHDAGQVIEVVTRANEGRVPRLRSAGITVHLLPFGGAVDIYTPFALRRIVSKFRPDIVQSWMSRASQKVTRWSASMGIDPYVVVSRLGGYYKIKNFKNTDYFVTITPDLKKYLVEKCDVQDDRVLQINNFAETEVFETAIDRGAYGVPEGAQLCLGLGRLHSSKAFDTLIRAVAALPDVYLWIAGEGPDRSDLEALIDDLKVQNRVKLLGWRDDRAALFDAADICVFSSRYEPFGTVFVQAWAQKTPLVTTDSDGPRQFVRHEEDGLVTPIDDISLMSASISRVISDDDLRNKMVENGYHRYLREFTKDNTVQKYLTYFRHIRKLEKL